ncbi:MAG: T9SS type A sorting domain-containing protein [Nonlabens sp.]
MKAFNFYALSCLFLLFANYADAQSDILIKWDSSVGCINYDDEIVGENLDVTQPLEGISNADCIKFCVDTEMKFSLNDPNGDIVNVRWTQLGGTQIGSDTAQEFKVRWNNVTNNAAITVTVSLQNGSSIERELCVQVIDKPVANFDFLAGFEKRCSGNFQLINNSYDPSGSDLVAYEWLFAGPNGVIISSSDEEPEVTLTEGLWQVALTATNACNCSGKIEKTIEVEDRDVVITCPTVVCEGSSEFYTLEEPIECEEFSWNATGGTILSGQESAIVNILWDNVEDGFGYLTFNQSSCNSCSEEVITKIPVIQARGKINGDATICNSEQSLFDMPRWPSVEFEWELIDANGNVIRPYDILITTDQPNEIAINTENLEPGPGYVLTCRYNSPLLLCGGEASKVIRVSEQQGVEGVNSTCINSTETFNSSYQDSGITWEVFYNGVSIDVVNSNSLQNYLFDRAGEYTITALSDLYCISENHKITVGEEPPVVPSLAILEGDIEDVCIEVPYNYSINNLDENYYLEWFIDPLQGSIVGSTTGNNIVASYLEPSSALDTHELLVRYVSVAGNCPGPWRTQQITPINFRYASDSPIIHYNPADPIDPVQSVANQRSFCSSSSANFRIDLDNAETYFWYFENEAYGSITSGQGTNDVVVSFNEVPTGLDNSTFLKVELRKCNVVYDKSSVELLIGLQGASLGFPQNVTRCGGEFMSYTIPASELPFGFDINTWVSEFEVTYRNLGAPIVNETMEATSTFLNSSGDFVVTGLQVPLPSQFGQFVLNINLYDPTFCDPNIGTGYEFFNLINPTPYANIIRSGNDIYCDVSEVDVQLTAVYQNPSSGNVTYQWKRNGVEITGATANTLSVTPALGGGFYTCTLSYVNGVPSTCEIDSEGIQITVNNCTSQGCSVETVEITNLEWDGCDIIELDVLTTGGTLNSTNVFTYDNLFVVISNTGNHYVLQGVEDLMPGSYNIIASAAFGSCSITDTEVIQIGYQADLAVTVDCPTNGVHNVTLINTGLVLDTYTNSTTVSYELVGHSTAIVDNSGSYTFNNVPNGTYTANLMIDGVGTDPVCIASQELVISSPDAGFTIVDAMDVNGGAITQTCTECPFTLVPNTPNPDHDYSWNFLGIASNTQMSPTIALPIGVQPITLVVTDQNGCSVSQTKQIDVISPQYTGIYNGFGTYCEGSLINLTYIPDISDDAIAPSDSINASQSGFLWMMGEEEASGINTNATYNPTRSGAYWVKLRNQDYCLDDLETVNVTILPEPFFELDVPATVCLDQEFEVLASVRGMGTGIDDYRWIIDGDVGAWLDVFPIEPLEEIYGTLGTHAYELEVRTSSGCSFSKAYNLDVVTPPDAPIVNHTLVNSNPYTVELSIQNISNATYHWSNGDSGNIIEVTRGGAYQVTMIPNSSTCTVTADFYLPKDPSQYLWYFPTGCLDYCAVDDFPDRYIPGGTAFFDYWNYVGSYANLDGDNAVADYFLEQLQNGGGSLLLELDNLGSTVSSDTLVLTVDEECRECSIDLEITETKKYEEPFVYFELTGVLINNSTQDLNLDLSVVGINGFFNPAIISIPGNSSINLNPLQFIPQGAFAGGTVTILMEHVGIEDSSCVSSFELSFPESSGRKGRMASNTMKVHPNPVTDRATVDYAIFDSKGQNLTLEIYDLFGVRIVSQRLKQSQGEVSIALSQLPPSQYIIVIRDTTEVLIQSHIVKK